MERERLLRPGVLHVMRFVVFSRRPKLTPEQARHAQEQLSPAVMGSCAAVIVTLKPTKST